jgi:crossover junction endodeoxyribonuclease RuvC
MHNPIKYRRLLGIDPGTATVGYGVVDQFSINELQCVATGTIRTSKSDLPGKRLSIIREDIIELIKQFTPHAIIVEALFFFKNAKSMVPVAQARGVVLEAATVMNLPTFEYSPLQVKQVLTGYGRCDKREIQRMVAIVLNHAQIIKPDDAADALAVAICHARSSAFCEDDVKTALQLSSLTMR